MGALVLVAVGVWRYGPFEHRVFDHVTALALAPSASIAIPAGVRVDVQPSPGFHNSIDHLRLSRDELALRLSSELGGPSVALAQRSHAQTVAVAYEIHAADVADEHHVYLYGVVYERAWDPYGLSAGGFEPVRIAIDPLADWGHLVSEVEVKAPHGSGSSVDGPYPRWVDGALVGDPRLLDPLVGHD